MVNARSFILVPLLGLAGCATTGNIHGDFACAAPGGTCAPMGSIDAAAISSIVSGRTTPMSSGGIDSPRVQRSLSGQVIAGEPQRTSDRVLRVVFPAHIDTDGVFREEAAAHAVFQPSEWAQALGVRPEQPRGVGLRAAGAMPAPAPTSALATLDEIVAARAVGAVPAPAAAPPVSFRPDMQPVAGNASPSALSANALPAAMRPALVMPFQPIATRSVQPQSLAEAAAGLEAPRIPRLDPRDPAANYDTPDVAAPMPKTMTASVQNPDDRVVARAELKAAMQSRQMAGTEPTSAAPFGTRPVRRKGKTYQMPYRSPQPVAAIAASAKPVQLNPTAALNKAALARSMSGPSGPALVPTSEASAAAGATPVAATPAYAPTVDASEASSRVSAMAAPVIAGAVEAGRSSAAAAGPRGMKLSFPTKASDLSELARVTTGTSAAGTPQ